MRHWTGYRMSDIAKIYFSHKKINNTCLQDMYPKRLHRFLYLNDDGAEYV